MVNANLDVFAILPSARFWKEHILSALSMIVIDKDIHVDYQRKRKKRKVRDCVG